MQINVVALLCTSFAIYRNSCSVRDSFLGRRHTKGGILRKVSPSVYIYLPTPGEREKKREVIYDFISSRIRIVPDASSTSSFHRSLFFPFLLCIHGRCMDKTWVMRFLSAAPAHFLARFPLLWSAKEYPWWMLSSFLFLFALFFL